jgi:anion-transporting  ArsA/GET3 family ATPase
LAGPPLTGLIEQGRIVICAGCGGVGKTTTAAALAVLAAGQGRRVLALTIDPAQRLSASLGLRGRPEGPQPVELDAAPPGWGSLHVLLNDPKATFDELIKKHAPSATAARRILENPLYEHLSTKLAGVGEYMAMEKLLTLRDSEQFDLIVLDTPPTRNALDFLAAPARMVEALDSGAARWFIRAFAAPKESGKGVLRRGVARVMRGIGKLSSSAFLQEFATLLAELDDLFEGFSERAERVSLVLRSAEVSYLVISTPDSLALAEARFFLDYLRGHGMGEGRLLVNRVRPAIEPRAPLPDLCGALAQLGVKLDAEPERRVQRALEEEIAWAAQDAERVRDARALVSPDRLLLLPALRGDVHDVSGLLQLSQLLGGA